MSPASRWVRTVLLCPGPPCIYYQGTFYTLITPSIVLQISLQNALLSGICFALVKRQRSHTVKGRTLLRHEHLSMPRWNTEMLLCGRVCFHWLSEKDELQHSWWRWWTHIAVTFCPSVCFSVPAVLCFVFDTPKCWKGVEFSSGPWLWQGNMTKHRDNRGQVLSSLSPSLHPNT